MKYRSTAAVLVAMLLLTGCAQNTPSEADPAPAQTEETEAEKTISEQEMTRRYAVLMERFNEAAEKDDANRSFALHTIDEYYNTTLADYQAQYPQIRETEKITGKTTVLPCDSDPKLEEYSPLAALYYSTELDINPVSLFEKLEKPVNAGGYQKIVDDLPATVRTKAELYAEREAMIADKLRYNVADVEYEIGYAEDEGLYYVYLVDADTNLHIAALYFGFDADGTLRRTGLDYVIYTGADLSYTDDAGKTWFSAVPLLSDEAAPLPAEDAEETTAAAEDEEPAEIPGLPVPEAEQGALYYTLRTMLYSMLGSAPKLSEMVNPEEVTATASVREYRMDDGALAGLHVVNWYSIEEEQEETE